VVGGCGVGARRHRRGVGLGSAAPAALPGERKSRSPCWTAAPGPDPGSR